MIISILAVLADRDLLIREIPNTRNISILAVLADRDLFLSMIPPSPVYFNPRGPCGPRQVGDGSYLPMSPISILAVLADRDGETSANHTRQTYFNPRGPCGPRPNISAEIVFLSTYFNPRGPYGPRQKALSKLGLNLYISILAVLADRDSTPSCLPDSEVLYFNPRGPCGPRLS